MAKQVTETAQLHPPFDLATHDKQVLKNHIAFRQAHTADEMHLLNIELEGLVRQIEEAAA